MKMTNIELQYKKILKKFINKGDTIFLHVDLSGFYKVYEIAKNKNEFYHFFERLLIQLIGSEGTLITPSFSYSWKKGKSNSIFDLKKTPSSVGFFSNEALKSKIFTRTLDPIFSVLICGKHKNFFYDIGQYSFGENSIYEKLIEKDAKLIFLGIKKFEPTFVHYIEHQYNKHYKKYPYRFNKSLRGKIIKNNKVINKKIICYLRPKNSNYIYNEPKVRKSINKNKILKKLLLDNNVVQMIKAKDLYYFGINQMIKNEKFFITEK